MRLPNEAHTSCRWRIHEIAADFTVEDVWALPAYGEAHGFPTLLEVLTSIDFPVSAPLPVRVLWNLRDLLGRWFGLGRISQPVDERSEALPIPGTSETTLGGRVPHDLGGTAVPALTRMEPFRPLYLTNDEFAAEVSNRTVHAVLHLAWVEQGDGCYRGQLAVLVKPRGRFGEAYMTFIRPFRHALVYPALMRAIEQAWNLGPRATTSRFAPTADAPTTRASSARGKS